MSYRRSKTSGSIKPKLFKRRSIEDTKTLFKRTKTQPIEIGKIFDGGHRDAYYHKSFTQEAQRAEKELFFDGEDEESKNTNTLEVHHQPNWAMKLNIYDPEFNQEKMDKILVATCMVWDDTNYNQNLTKLELLVQANADINTKQGGGMFKQTLLIRMMYEGERKLRLQRALINLADHDALEPRVGKTPLEIVSSSYNYEIMKLLLDKNCEPNRIAKKNGMTPLITICRYNSRYAGDEFTEKRLKCLNLLVNHEGPDARKLKKRFAEEWDNMCPDGIEKAWLNVADFCIPNINVQPAFKGKNVADYLQSYDNPTLFDKEALELVGRLCKDAVVQKEKYWPRDRQEYIKLFEPRWAAL